MKSMQGLFDWPADGVGGIIDQNMDLRLFMKNFFCTGFDGFVVTQITGVNGAIGSLSLHSLLNLP
jgi:hypothetical protein